MVLSLSTNNCVFIAVPGISLRFQSQKCLNLASFIPLYIHCILKVHMHIPYFSLAGYTKATILLCHMLYNRTYMNINKNIIRRSSFQEMHVFFIFPLSLTYIFFSHTIFSSSFFSYFYDM